VSRKGERGCVFAVFFAPFPEKGILDLIVHGSIIRVLTVWASGGGGRGKKRETRGGAVDAGWHPRPYPPSPWFKERGLKESLIEHVMANQQHRQQVKGAFGRYSLGKLGGKNGREKS